MYQRKNRCLVNRKMYPVILPEDIFRGPTWRDAEPRYRIKSASCRRQESCLRSNAGYAPGVRALLDARASTISWVSMTSRGRVKTELRVG